MVLQLLAENAVTWGLITQIDFCIDCYHFESPYLILIWVTARWKSCVGWKISPFHHRVWLKKGLLLFSVTDLESRQDKHFVIILILKIHYSCRITIALYDKRTLCVCVCVWRICDTLWRKVASNDEAGRRLFTVITKINWLKCASSQCDRCPRETCLEDTEVS